MKLHFLFLQISIFLCTIIFFVLPPLFPLFNSELFSQTFTFSWAFSFTRLMQFLYAVILLIVFSKIKNNYPDSIQQQKNSSLAKLGITFRYIFPAFFVFCLLFFISLILKAFSLYLNSPTFESQSSVSNPQNLTEWIFCILTFFFSAFYEEVIYRLYLPSQCRLFFRKKFVRILCYLLIMLCFSAAHLYLGIFSAVNALIAHIILRFCCRKTDSVLPGTGAHFLYNLLSLLLL